MKASKITPSNSWQSMGWITSLLYERLIRFLVPYHRGRSKDPEASWISDQLFADKVAAGSTSLKPGRDQYRRSRHP